MSTVESPLLQNKFPFVQAQGVEYIQIEDKLILNLSLEVILKNVYVGATNLNNGTKCKEIKFLLRFPKTVR